MSGGSLRLIDLDTAAVLADVYRLQEILDGNVGRLANGVFTTLAVFGPASRAATVKLLWLTMADICSSEFQLLKVYGDTLPGIRAAASRR